MAAPLKPEPGSNAQMIVMPNTGASAPAKSNIEQATDEARARLAQGGSAMPPSSAAAARAAAQPRVAGGQPQGGQFAQDQLRREIPGGQPDEAVEETPRPDPGEQREVRPEEHGVVPDEQGQPPVPDEGDEEGADVPEERAVVIPGLTEDEEELHVEFEDPAVASRLREIVSQASQIDRREQEVLQSFDEIDQMRESVTTDPVGFALNVIGQDQQALDHLVLGALTQPEVWQRLQPTLAKMVADPNEARLVAAEQKGRRADYRDEASRAIVQRREVRENLSQIQQAVASVIPETLDAERANVAFADMLRDLKEYADRYDLLTIPLHDLPTLLQRRLTALGIDPGEASQRMQRAALRRAPRGRSPLAGRAPAAPNGNGHQPPNGRPSSKPNGQAFVASQDRRRAVAAIPSGGAGAPTSRNDLTPPRDKDGNPLGIAATIEWHRGRVKKGVKAY